MYSGENSPAPPLGFKEATATARVVAARAATVKARQAAIRVRVAAARAAIQDGARCVRVARIVAKKRRIAAAVCFSGHTHKRVIAIPTERG